MKKFIFTLLASIGIVAGVQAQYGEFQYFSLRAGVSSNFLSTHATAPNYYFLQTDFGAMKLYDKQSYFDYSMGAYAGAMFHYDINNDLMGFMVGALYSPSSILSEYVTNFNDYEMRETFRIHKINVPVVFKIGPDFYQKQSYAYAGFIYSYNFGLQRIQEVNWVTEKKVSWRSENEYTESNLGLVLGVNQLIFNFEIQYFPASFLNLDYREVIDLGSTQAEIRFYETQPKHLLFVTAGFHVPLTEWTTSRNYALHRFWRKFKFRR